MEAHIRCPVTVGCINSKFLTASTALFVNMLHRNSVNTGGGDYDFG